MGNILVRSAVVIVSACALVTGCASSPRPAVVQGGGGTTFGPGAATSTGAVEGFLHAAQETDARAMSGYFGTRAGPTTLRDPGADVEKRMISLACYLSHDSARVLGDVPGVADVGDRTVTVELRQRELVRQTRFTVVPGPGNRWFVQAFDIDAVSDLCRPH